MGQRFMKLNSFFLRKSVDMDKNPVYDSAISIDRDDAAGYTYYLDKVVYILRKKCIGLFLFS